ncbi:nickel import ATP-binding protein NikE [Kaistia defluvii]|uniref:nickel import ATP-binding protein NikE n=1 Tax=Kaistia defluvii TaxID=410841 RepID=UPI00224D9C83|nr:nickel import ATP-binding protein NikE [Kaistia defluvii]MCX5520888.1 nickel import ATP-binding protein NikE [Kaistia defluvii]
MSVILAARSVSKSYSSYSLTGRSAPKTVLRDVSLDIAAGESIALLGRSGSGKSTLGRLLLGFERPDGGSVAFENESVSGLSGERYRHYRRSVQVVFQDSLGAVNPRHSIGRIIAEPLRHLTDLNEDTRSERVRSLLAQVGLVPDDARKLPSQMSGGQLQRVCIARAIAPAPRLLVLDEAVSNLDLVLQIQMIALLRDLQARLKMAVLFITHDLRLVQLFCSRVIVLAEGRIQEDAPVTRGLALRSAEGRLLQDAILPARPVHRAPAFCD